MNLVTKLKNDLKDANNYIYETQEDIKRNHRYYGLDDDTKYELRKQRIIKDYIESLLGEEQT